MALKSDATRDAVALLQGGYLRVETVSLIRPGGLLAKQWQALIRLYTKPPGEVYVEPLGQCVDTFDYVDGADPVKQAYERIKSGAASLANVNHWSAYIGGDC